MFKLICKHLMRLKNTLYRRIKVFSFKCQYGKQFKAQKFHFREGFHIFIEESGIVKIGKNVFFNNNCSITSRKLVEIGDNCIFGENVKIYDHNHKFKDKNKLIAEQGFISEPVTIGNNCWISTNVTILKGVQIGVNTVIGTGVIVYKDIPKNSIIINKQDIINLGEDSI